MRDTADQPNIPVLVGNRGIAIVTLLHACGGCAHRLGHALAMIGLRQPEQHDVALHQARQWGKPTIFNSDQGVQFTADAFIACLEAAGIQISMDGRGRALDNIFIERLWRSVKYEDIYLKHYDSVSQLETGLADYFWRYNQERPHQSLNYRTPAELFFL